jgi:hypothetical protein
VAHQDSFDGSMMAAVAAGPNGFVAVGTVDNPGEAPSGLAWTSSDGSTWMRVEAGLTDGNPSGVVWDGQRYIAYGGGFSEVPAAIWTSPDGQTWQRSTDGPGFDEITTLFIAALGGQLFAIGGGWGDSEGPISHVFNTWSSNDGQAWAAVSAEPAPPGMVGLTGLAATSSMLLAWGNSDGGPDYRPIAVRSTDGIAWQAANIGKSDSRVYDISGEHGGFVAVGSGPYVGEAGAQAPVKAWTSSDGAGWSAAAFQPAPGNDQLEHVVWYGGRYVSLGTYAGSPISWLSGDGTAWTESQSVPDAAKDGDPCTGGPCPVTTVSDLAGGTAGLLAVGSKDVQDQDGRHKSWQSVVWFAPAVNP